MTTARTLDLTGIDWNAPATEVHDEVLARIQAARPDWDWNAQVEEADELVAQNLGGHGGDRCQHGECFGDRCRRTS